MMIMLPRTRLADAHSLTDSSHVDRVRREHDNVAEAIVADDPDTARAAMRPQLGNTRRRLVLAGAEVGYRTRAGFLLSNVQPGTRYCIPAASSRPPRALSLYSWCAASS